MLQLYKSEKGSIIVDKEKEIFIINQHADTFNPDEYDIIISYIVNFWNYVKNNNLKYSMLINSMNSTITNMPFSFLPKLILTLQKLNDIFKSHLHSIVILCNNKSYMLTILQSLVEFFNTIRPVKIVYKEEDVNKFFEDNKLN